MDIGKKIKELRKSKNLTQEEFSEQIGISRSYLSDLENNRKSPSVETLKQIAERSGCFLFVDFQTKPVKKQLIGEKIKKLRLDNGWTMEQLGERLNPKSSKGCVSNWENGHNNPNRQRTKELAELFDVTVEYLRG